MKNLSDSLGIKLINKDFKEKEDNTINVNIIENQINNIEKKDIEEFKNKIIYYKNEFNKIRKECCIIYQDIKQEKKIYKNYRKSINEICQQMFCLIENLNLSENNIIKNNQNGGNNEKIKNINEIYEIIDKNSSFIDELDKIIIDINNIFEEENIENLLRKIDQNLINDVQNYKNKEDLENINQENENIINEIKNICYIYEEKKCIFMAKEEEIEEKMSFLFEKINSLTDTENNTNNKTNRNDKNENDKKINSELLIKKGSSLSIKKESSFLYKLKSESMKFKIINKFNNKEVYHNNNENENLYRRPTLLRKNWQEICFVYDDYDIHDIQYNIEAVGIEGKSIPFGFHGFHFNSKYEILSLFIDGKESNHIKRDKFIQFDINLPNLQMKKIHIVYKIFYDSSNLPSERKERGNQLYKIRKYGLDNFFLIGQKAKYSLKLKGTFEIVDFKKYFLKRNENNLNEKEYFWEGVVPYEGKTTTIIFSKSIANWSFYQSNIISSNNKIKNAEIKFPILFLGGNNEIINIDAKSSETHNIILDEEKRKYILEFKNVNKYKCEFIFKGELKNRCKGSWDIDLKDEEADRMILEKYKLDQEQLKQLKEIAERIIEDYDKENKNIEYELLDYMKIALWVNKNIKYDLTYFGKDLTVLEIYQKKVGVCHHFTKLCNALLYSLGYKVIHALGYTLKRKISKEYNIASKHAWSIIKINNKWFPFDSTWGIVSGKLPVIYIFGKYTIFRSSNRKDIHFAKTDLLFKYNH